MTDLYSRLHLDDDSLEHDAFPPPTESILANGSNRLGRCKYNLPLRIKSFSLMCARSRVPQDLSRTMQVS